MSAHASVVIIEGVGAARREVSRLLDAVVGVQASVDGSNTITRFGVTCALCHSTVDNSLAPGIGRRLDGWPNLDLNPGLILSLSPALQAPTTQAVLTSWGAGKYDARWNHDGAAEHVPLA